MFCLCGDPECLKDKLSLFPGLYHKATGRRSNECEAEFGRDLVMGRELMDSCSDSEWWEQFTFGAFYFLMQLKYFMCAISFQFNDTSSYKLTFSIFWGRVFWKTMLPYFCISYKQRHWLPFSLNCLSKMV